MGVRRGVPNVFRAANERLDAQMEALSLDDRRPVICECSDPDCMTVIDVALNEYRAVREGGYFIVAIDHEAAGCDRIVERRSGYVVAEND